MSEKTIFNNNWNDFYNYLNKNLGKFQRRHFKEFSYLTVEPKTGALIFIYIFALLISIGVNIWVVKNDITDDSIEQNKRWKRNNYY